MIDLDFTADWMTKRYEIVKLITLRIYEKPIQVRITHNFGHSMKSALTVVTSYSILSHIGTYFYLPDISYESRQIKARCSCPHILQWLFLFVEHSLERHTVPLKSKLSPQDTTKLLPRDETFVSREETRSRESVFKSYRRIILCFWLNCQMPYSWASHAALARKCSTVGTGNLSNALLMLGAGRTVGLAWNWQSPIKQTCRNNEAQLCVLWRSFALVSLTLR